MIRTFLPHLLMASAIGLSGLQAQAQAQPQTDDTFDLLVGTYTQGASQGIYRMAFNSRTGMIETVPRQVVATDNPSWLALSREGGYLFAVNENGPHTPDNRGKVSSYAIDAASHQLTPLNQVASQSDEPTHASLTPDQRFLLVANYASEPVPGGLLSVFPVASDGRLGDAVQMFGPNPPSRSHRTRQRSSHVHAVVPAPDGRHVVAADLGADRLMVYRYDARLAQPLLPATVPAVAVPKGSGPRHLLFSADGRHAWLTLELSAQVMAFDYSDGGFRQTQLLDLIQPGSQHSGSAGGLHASDDGRFLYVANRGQANELLVFAIDPATGTLEQIQRRPVEGQEPREFAIDPTGRFVLIANQKSNRIVTLHRDPQTGLLGEVVQTLAIDSPSALVFLPAAATLPATINDADRR